MSEGQLGGCARHRPVRSLEPRYWKDHGAVVHIPRRERSRSVRRRERRPRRSPPDLSQRRSLPRHRGMRKGAKTKLKRLALQVLQIQENIGLGPTRLEFTPYPFRFFCPPSGRTPANQGNSESSRAFAPCGCEFPRSKPSESRIEREAASARRRTPC